MHASDHPASDVRVGAFGYSLGETRPLSAFGPLRTQPQRLSALERAGLRYYLESSKTPLQHATESIAATVTVAGIAPRDVDAIVYSSDTYAASTFRSAGYGQVGLAGVVQSLGFNETTPLIGLSHMACGNMVHALHLSAQLLRSHCWRTVLVVTSDICASDAERLDDRFPSPYLLSDGAASCLMSTIHPLPFELRAVVSHQIHRLPLQEGDDPYDASVMEALIEWNYSKWKAVLDQLIEQHGPVLDRLDVLIPPNWNLEFCRAFAEILPHRPRTVFSDNISRLAHLGGADPLINLRDYSENRLSSDPESLLVYYASTLIQGAMLLVG